ncbi:class I SAM-dependent methyltransferase [Saccharopolyspora pogona]|uniref:class I SAM-dependent methyltransferase n=1 Tax=Saccharopolyspora pogona TaxID=333966 RepID=UPI0021DFF642|nr:class I SAM-dependent methyltransferase [Saccharopolyspora pogona]
MLDQAAVVASGADNISFVQHDVLEMPKLGTFDLAVVIYLIQYAKTIDELAAMYRNIAANVRSGGQFVALTVDSRFRHGEGSTEKYGFSVAPVVEPRDEDRLSFTMFSDPPVTVDCTHFERSTHERVAKRCGFRTLRWHELRVDPGLEGGADFYRDFLDNPPFVLLSAEMGETRSF